jgi:REP element-mobilizing transposase RayT
VTIRVRRGVWNLRSQRCFNRIAQAFSAVKKRESFRVTHFSVQGNHVHLIVEAADRPALSNGMRALLIRIARSLNALMGTHGRLYEDRYHETVVTTPSQLRTVVRYVLENHAKHMREIGKPAPAIDPFSSAVRRELVADAHANFMRNAFS